MGTFWHSNVPRFEIQAEDMDNPPCRALYWAQSVEFGWIFHGIKCLSGQLTNHKSAMSFTMFSVSLIFCILLLLQTLAEAGIGSVVRVLTDRKLVWSFLTM